MVWARDGGSSKGSGPVGKVELTIFGRTAADKTLSSFCVSLLLEDKVDEEV